MSFDLQAPKLETHINNIYNPVHTSQKTHCAYIKTTTNKAEDD